MYDMNTILKAMAEGKTADDLAKEFSNALNAAIAEDKRIKEEEAAKAAAEAAKMEQVAAIKDLFDQARAFISKYYGKYIPADFVDAFNAPVSDEDALALINEIENYLKMIPMIMKFADLDNLNVAPIKKVKAKKPSVNTLSKNEAEDILSQFLASLDFI
jgi:integrase